MFLKSCVLEVYNIGINCFGWFCCDVSLWNVVLCKDIDNFLKLFKKDYSWFVLLLLDILKVSIKLNCKFLVKFKDWLGK